MPSGVAPFIASLRSDLDKLISGVRGRAQREASSPHSVMVTRPLFAITTQVTSLVGGRFASFLSRVSPSSHRCPLTKLLTYAFSVPAGMCPLLPFNFFVSLLHYLGLANARQATGARARHGNASLTSRRTNTPFLAHALPTPPVLIHVKPWTKWLIGEVLPRMGLKVSGQLVALRHSSFLTAHKRGLARGRGHVRPPRG